MPHFPALFSPYQIGRLTIKNRLVMAPMASNYADSHGEVTDVMVDYYRERAKGGVGLIIVEAACVDSPLGREGFRQLNVDHPSCITGLQRLAEEIKACGSGAFLQLFHAGRQTSTYLTDGQQLVAPSAIPCPMMKEMPRALNREEINNLLQKFVNAATYAHKAGFDGVELHAAHGYLINQFLSPHSNQRDDEYGGSLQKRTKFLLDIMAGIKARLPGYPVSVRLNMDDFVPGGLSLEESLNVGRELERSGADIIHCSCGTYESGLTSIEPSSYPEGWRIYLSQALKEVVHIPIIGGGMMRSPERANQVIAEGQADFVFLGRPLLADPDWPDKAARGKVEDIRPCIGCNHCIDNNFNGLAVRCTVNPHVGRERYHQVFRPIQTVGKAIVAGGGPAGMQAALALQERGLQVCLYERENVLGGAMNLAGLPPHKNRILLWRDYLIRQIQKAPIEIRLNHAFQLADVEQEQPDIVVIATGSKAIRPVCEGAEESESYLGAELLQNGIAWSGLQVVVIGGGSSGCELAEMIALQNNRVTIVEQDHQLAGSMEKKNRRDLLNRLEAAGVKKLCTRKVNKLKQDGMILVDADGREEELRYDRLVWATGFVPDNQLFYEVFDKVPRAFLIGDAREVRGFEEAIREGETLVGMF